jgi:serine/threonine protein kinase/WD40 repeat protein
MDQDDPRDLHQYLSKHLPENMVEEVLKRIESKDSFQDYLSTYDGSSVDGLTRVDAINLSRSHPLEVIEALEVENTLSSEATESAVMSPVSKPAHKNILKPGDAVAHFQVTRLIGRGGMGEVYLARDAQLGRKVALKVIRQVDVDRDTGLRRFINEARITARFNHPHIVTIYAVGQFDAHLYVALEYLEGQDLAQRMAEEPLSLQESLRVCLAVGEAIAEAHRHGILHRDLKPANILMPKDGRVRVVDFGLAKEVELPKQADLSAQTQDQQSKASPSPKIVGTPAYMSPEQWRGKETQPGTDIWALGVTLFELICNHRPYGPTNSLKGGMEVCSPTPVPMPETIDGLPPRVSQLLRACLEKDVERRPTAQHVVSVIQEIISDHRSPSRDSESPFRGLRPFSERHSDLFFGRDIELSKAVERLRYEPGLVVVGASGAGKTSFTQAGLIPRLKESQDWLILKLRPGDAPIERLAHRIISAHQQETLTGSTMGSVRGPEVSEDSENSRIDSHQLEIEALTEKIRISPKKLHLSLRDLALQKQRKVLLVIDQLEEVFTLCRDPEKQRLFIQCIANAVDESSEPFRIICTVRDDFLGHVARTGDAARGLLEHMMVLDPPDKKALKDVLMMPLLRVGYSFDDPKLADEMVSALDGGTSLPLLQFAARSLWESRDQVNRLLTRADYEAMGGVEGALARHADGVLDGLAQEELLTAKKLLLRLVTPEETRKTVREAELLDGLPSNAHIVYQRLIKSRLLALSRSAKTRDGAGQLELAHDSLIKTWQTLAQWIEDSKEELIILAEVSQAAELWQRRGRRVEELWTSTGLRDAERLLSHTQSELPVLVQDFIHAGQYRTKQIEQRRRLWSISVPLILIALAAVLTLQKRDAEVSREASEKGRIQAVAQRKIAIGQRSIALKNQLESLLESAQSAFAQGAYLESRAKLRSALELSNSEPEGFHGLAWQLDSVPELWLLQHGSFFYRSAFSWGGAQVAATSIDGSIHLIDVATKTRRVLRGHTDQAIALAYSPDDRHLATAGLEKNIRIWNLEQLSLKYALPAPKGIISELRFSPDGNLLAARGRDGQVRVWNLRERSFLDVKRKVKSTLRSLFFDAQNKLQLVEGEQKEIWIRGLGEATPSYLIQTNPKTKYRADVSLDGSRLILASGLGVAQVHDLNHRRLIRRFENIVADNHLFALNHGGDHAVFEARGGTLNTYNVDSGLLLGSVRLKKRGPSRVALSPDGKMISEPALDYLRLSKTGVRLDRQESQNLLNAIYAMSVDPKTQEIVSTTINEDMMVRDGRSGKLKPNYPDMGGANRDGIAHSANGQYLGWVTRDRRVVVWDRIKKRQVFVAPGSVGQLSGLRFAGMSDRLVMLTDFELRVWDLAQKKPIVSEKWVDSREATLAVSRSGKRVLLGFGGKLGPVAGWSEVWDIERGTMIKRLKGQDDYTIGVGFGPEDKWLLTSTWSGAVYRWNKDGTTFQKLLDVGQRINGLSLHPNGDRIALAQSNGTPKIIWLDGGRTISPIGHVHEVNHVQFTADGKHLASGGDDGTIRLWNADTGKPIWNAVALISTPARMLTHEGWQRIDGEPLRADDETHKAWAQHTKDNALIADEYRALRRICIATKDDHLELWDTQADVPIWRKPMPDIRQIKMIDSGCIVRDNKSVVRYAFDGSGHRYDVGQPIKTLSMHNGQIVVGTNDKIVLFQGATPTASFSISPGITSHLLISKPQDPSKLDIMLVGFQDGSIERFKWEDDELSVPTLIHQRTAAPVTHLITGRRQLLLVGFADGRVIIMNQDSGRSLDSVRLHGAIRFLQLDENQAHAITDLGDHFSWDVSTFNVLPCVLTQTVWKEIPVVWSLGKAKQAQVPVGHRCRTNSSPTSSDHRD